MNAEMEMMLKGYGLTTAQIFYRMPDHPTLLQSYVWQNYDLAPDFPEMKGFLKFWEEKLDGPLHGGLMLRPLRAGPIGSGRPILENPGQIHDSLRRQQGPEP